MEEQGISSASDSGSRPLQSTIRRVGHRSSSWAAGIPKIPVPPALFIYMALLLTFLGGCHHAPKPPFPGLVSLAAEVGPARTLAAPGTRNAWTCPGPVRRFLQDGSRVMAATEGGLVRIEGAHTDLVTTEWGLPNHELRDLVPWRGDVYLASGEGLIHLPENTARLISFPREARRSAILCLLPDQNVLWLGTSDGLILWDGHRAWGYPVGSPGTRERVLSLVRVRDQIIVNLEKSGLRSVHEITLEPLSGLPDGPFSAIEGGQALWLGTPRGLFRWESGRASNIPPVGSGSSPAVSTLCAFGGQLWCGDFEGGLRRMVGGRLAPFEWSIREPITAIGPMQEGILLGTASGPWNGSGLMIEDALPGNQVTAILSGDGETWVGTFRDGLVRIDAEGHISAPLGGLPSDEINALLRQGSDLLVATQRGVARVLSGSQPQVRSTRYADLRCLCLSTWRGDLLIGTGKGLIIERQGTPRLIGRDEGLPGETVYSIAIQGDTLWIGTSGGLAKMVGTGSPFPVRDPAIPSGWVTALVVGPDGFLGGTYGGGVFCLRGGHFKRIRERLSVNSGAALRIGEQVFLGTAEEGLVAVSSGECLPWRGREGLPGSNVLSLAATGDTLCVWTTGGIARIISP